MAGDDEIADLGDAVAKVNLGPTITTSLAASPPRKEGDASKQDIGEQPSSEDDDDADGDDDDDADHADHADDEGGVAVTTEDGQTATTLGAPQEPDVTYTYRDCVPCETERPVEVTFNKSNNAFCFGLHFINCTFSGPLSLCIHNCIVRNVVFIDCHFELTRFSDCVMEDMKVVSCTYHDAWWFNREFTSDFIIIGGPQDGTEFFDGARNGMGDDLPEKLQTSEYKDSLFSSQKLPSEEIAEQAWKWPIPTGQDATGGLES